ncbi:mediator of RNA polymerase II transcription subunit 32 [Herrania umbratica]|uniref:Mediator of RNA polymerase II transcription subunit 32 n=1 Tax=Herrania umbratica TaxID=108875 RepID=A0A6J1BDP6_9ROSI|nr:mediator of RNA polymerase II transcription subunit 32 [Herrania umbratica]
MAPSLMSKDQNPDIAERRPINIAALYGLFTYAFDSGCKTKSLSVSLVKLERRPDSELKRLGVMDNIVDSLSSAYQEFVAAAANVLETKETSAAQKTADTDAALETFKQKWELFRVACDQAEEFVESIKQRIGSECLVDEATGSMAGKSGQALTTGLPPISAVRLEQMSKAVRWLVIELQHGSGNAGGAAHAHPSAPFDARFSEDAAQ